MIRLVKETRCRRRCRQEAFAQPRYLGHFCQFRVALNEVAR